MKTPDNSRRLALLAMSQAMLTSMLKSMVFPTGERRTFSVVENALPEDAKAVRSFFCPERGMQFIVVQSAEFDEVPESERLPVLESPIIQTHVVDEVPA